MRTLCIRLLLPINTCTMEAGNLEHHPFCTGDLHTYVAF